MNAVHRNNAFVGAAVFSCWFALNLFGRAMPSGSGLISLAVVFVAFSVASYFGLQNGWRKERAEIDVERNVVFALLWAIGWTTATVVVSFVVIAWIFGIGFKHI